jgi:inositol oxygenase
MLANEVVEQESEVPEKSKKSGKRKSTEESENVEKKPKTSDEEGKVNGKNHSDGKSNGKNHVDEEGKTNGKSPSEDKEETKEEDSVNGKKLSQFRNYVNSNLQDRVSNFYHEQHKNQTYDYVVKMEEKYLKLEMANMSLWDCLEYMDGFVDHSDPDTENSQMQHALQTAESIRAKYPGEEYDWFHVTGLIHDLGKILSYKGGEPQWGVTGDSFPMGCAFSEKNIFPQFFKENPDSEHKVYSTQNGVYEPHCGLEKVKMCWGHDEYMYQVCVRNNCTLPKSALYMIRFHSFYPWHRERAYTHLTTKEDEEELLPWVLKFNECDLYSKAFEKLDPAKYKPYYEKVINKYFPSVLRW